MPEPSSCISHPFIKLGDPNKAPILDYSLPQETCYDINMRFPLFIPNEFFKEECFVIPENNLFKKFEGKSIQEIINMLKEDILSGTYNCFLRGFLLKRHKDAIKIITPPERVVQSLIPHNIQVALNTINSAYTASPGASSSGVVKQNASDSFETTEVRFNLKPNKEKLDSPPIAATSAFTPYLKGLTGNGIRLNHMSFIPVVREQQIQVAGYTLDYLANKIAEGFLLVLEEDESGKLTIRFLRKPPVAQPRISIIEHHKMCSYLGDYGAGKVIKTFSMYPGEVTQITMRNFKDNKQSYYKDSVVSSNVMSSTYYSQDEVDISTKSESILDGDSKYARTQVQKGIQDRTMSRAVDAWSSSEEEVNNSGEGSSEALNILGIYSTSSGGGSSATTNTSTTSSGIREHATDILNYAIDDQVDESNSYRNMEVNETSANSKNKTYGGNDLTQNTNTVSEGMHQIITTGEEATTIRYLRNINLSRTLNLVFRQMLQEFVSVTFLNDASFVYTNGYPETEQVNNILTLDDLLKTVIKTEHIAAVRKAVQLHFCNVFDYEGVKHSFIEKIVETYDDCETHDPDETYTYWRKKRNLSQTYNSGSLTITVHGIITSVKHRTLKTDSAIVDALLGQGEALDCYNMNLQVEAVNRTRLENQRFEMETMDMHSKIQEALNVINDITDPEAKAEAYRKMLNDCCLDDIKLILGSMCNHTPPPPAP